MALRYTVIGVPDDRITHMSESIPKKYYQLVSNANLFDATSNVNPASLLFVPHPENQPNGRKSKKKELLGLPEEVIDNIMLHLNSNGVNIDPFCAVRLTCQKLRRIAIPHFGRESLTERFHNVSKKSLKALVQNTAHPDLRKCVTKLVLDTAILNHILEGAEAAEYHIGKRLDARGVHDTRDQQDRGDRRTAQEQRDPRDRRIRIAHSASRFGSCANEQEAILGGRSTVLLTRSLRNLAGVGESIGIELRDWKDPRDSKGWGSYQFFSDVSFPEKNILADRRPSRRSDSLSIADHLFGTVGRSGIRVTSFSRYLNYFQSSTQYTFPSEFSMRDKTSKKL